MSNEPSTHNHALTVYQKVENPIDFAKEMATDAAAMVGAQANQGRAIALHCLCEGLTLVEFGRRYHWIGNRPSMRADAMLAEFRLNYGGKHKINKRTHEECEIEFTTSDGETQICSLAFAELLDAPFIYCKGKGLGDDINQPGVLKDNWAYKYGRRAMLFARCVSDSLRAICPELVAGVYTPEELSDTVIESVVAAPTVTVDDMMARAQSQTPPAPEEDVVDVEPEPAAVSADVEAIPDPRGPGSISERNRELLPQLFAECGFDHQKQVKILAKRQANSLRNLSDQQAEEIIGNCRAFLQQQKDQAGE